MIHIAHSVAPVIGYNLLFSYIEFWISLIYLYVTRCNYRSDASHVI